MQQGDPHITGIASSIADNLALCWTWPRLATIDGLFVSVTVTLLAFIMGLRNAIVPKLSHAEIRTTHFTGIVTDIVTDIGIELGKAMYRNADCYAGTDRVLVNRARLLLAFFGGGLWGHSASSMSACKGAVGADAGGAGQRADF